MQAESIEFHRANDDPESTDSKLIWEWRNDPVTRQMSRNTDLIPWASHKQWYAKVALEGKILILIASFQGLPCCMISYSYQDKESAEISINMNPEMRGKGLGKNVLLEACKYGFDQLYLEQIQAEVKPENISSIKIFEGIGFVYKEDSKGLRHYELMPDNLRS